VLLIHKFALKKELQANHQSNPIGVVVSFIFQKGKTAKQNLVDKQNYVHYLLTTVMAQMESPCPGKNNDKNKTIKNSVFQWLTKA